MKAPTELYCLNCGQVVMANYRGEIMGLVHCCSGYHSKTRAIQNECKVLTTEKSVLLNASLLSGVVVFSNCKECKTAEEHTERVIQDYLGKRYNEFTPSNKQVADFKLQFIQKLKELVR